MKTLLILRHAKSSWNHEGLSDYERPLNKRGKQNAPQMGELIKREDIVPDLIITSSAERALTTAEHVAMNCDFEGDLKHTRRFYLAEPEEYIEVLSQEVDDAHACVMVVGHNPGMGELVAWLTREHHRFTTANLAQVELPIESWQDLTMGTRGRLVNLWRPKEL